MHWQTWTSAESDEQHGQVLMGRLMGQLMEEW